MANLLKPLPGLLSYRATELIFPTRTTTKSNRFPIQNSQTKTTSVKQQKKEAETCAQLVTSRANTDCFLFYLLSSQLVVPQIARLPRGPGQLCVARMHAAVSYGRGDLLLSGSEVDDTVFHLASRLLRLSGRPRVSRLRRRLHQGQR